jgi:hypothetical protein
VSNPASPPITQLLRIMTTALGAIIAVVRVDATAQITNWTATGTWLWFAAFATLLLANMIVMLRAQSASLVATQQPASSHTRATPPIDRI